MVVRNIRTYRNVKGFREHFGVHLPLSHPEVFGRNILVASFGEATAAYRRAGPPVRRFAFHYHHLSFCTRKTNNYLILTLTTNNYVNLHHFKQNSDGKSNTLEMQ